MWGIVCLPQLGLLLDGKARRPWMQIRCLEYVNLFPICTVCVLPPPVSPSNGKSLLLQGKKGAHEAAECDIWTLAFIGNEKRWRERSKWEEWPARDGGEEARRRGLLGGWITAISSLPCLFYLFLSRALCHWLLKLSTSGVTIIATVKMKGQSG